MFTADPVILHLTQQELSEHDKAILTGLKAWLFKAKFGKKHADDFESCVDDELSKKLTLLKDMNLIKKVRQVIIK